MSYYESHIAKTVVHDIKYVDVKIVCLCFHHKYICIVHVRNQPTVLREHHASRKSIVLNIIDGVWNDLVKGVCINYS